MACLRESAKGTHLAVSMRGNVLCVLGNVPRGRTPDYLACESVGTSQSDRALYGANEKAAQEILQELGQAICRLANLAHPTASSYIRGTLSKDQFVDGLEDWEMRIRIKLSRSTNLNEAIKLAVELEVYNRAERNGHLRTAMAEPGDNASDSSLSSMLSKVMEKFDNL